LTKQTGVFLKAKTGMAHFLPPFNLQQWITENRHLLKPPVGNQQVYQGNEDFIVMVVGGPNARKDYHFNEGEELFYQVEGTIELKLVVEGVFQSVKIGPGDMFLLPPRTLHSPQRGPNTVGLVIERYRKPSEQDGFFWFCENCGNQLYSAFVNVKDIVKQLPVVMESFFSNPDLCTCKVCGARMNKPALPKNS
jgi:3-hydroxyanthranilate 3,4-dioxygenase